MLLQTLLLLLSHKTCTLTCAVICSWNCCDLISTLHPSSWEIIYFSPLGRNSTAYKAISVCLKEGNKPATLPSGRPSGDRSPPWPAAPVQPCSEAQIPPSPTRAQRGPGCCFPASGHFTCSRLNPSPPAPVRKEKPWEWSSTPRGRLTPATEERLTPSAPASSPPRGRRPQGRLAGRSSSKALRLWDWPRPAPRTAASPHWQALPRGRLARARAHSAVPQAGGQPRADLPFTYHGPPGFPRTPVAPAALPFSISILHQHTESQPREESTLSTLPASPKGCPLNGKVSSSLHQSTFSSFCSACCGANAVLLYKAALAPRRARGQQSAGMSGVKLAFPFSWPAPTLAEYRAILCSLIKHEKAEGLTHSSFHGLARCPRAVTPWHPGQRERRRPNCSQLQWITRSPQSPPPQGAWIPPSGKGIMSAWLRWLLSQKKPSFGGGWGGVGVLLQKLLPQKSAKRLPARPKNRDFC